MVRYFPLAAGALSANVTGPRQSEKLLNSYNCWFLASGSELIFAVSLTRVTGVNCSYLVQPEPCYFFNCSLDRSIRFVPLKSQEVTTVICPVQASCALTVFNLVSTKAKPAEGRTLDPAETRGSARPCAVLGSGPEEPCSDASVPLQQLLCSLTGCVQGAVSWQ